jgi:hypothetical protein
MVITRTGQARQGEAERRPRRRSNNGAVGQQHRHATLLPDHAVALKHEVGDDMREKERNGSLKHGGAQQP